jgi:hypothetical protein
LHNIKLFLILKSLSPAEIKEFGKFAASPFHNSNKTLIKFFNILKKHYPDFSSRALDMGHVYKRLFSAKPYNSGVIRNLISELIRLTEYFLAYQNFRNNKQDFYFNLLTQLKQRDIEKLFAKASKDAFDYLESSDIRDENYYFNKYNLESIQREFYMTKFQVGKRQNIYEKLPSLTENLKYAFFIFLLKEFFFIQNVHEQQKFSYSYKFLKEMIEHISQEEEEFKNVPLIIILRDFISLLEGKNEHRVPEFKKILDKNRKTISFYDFRNFYLELINYYKNKKFYGDVDAGRKAFELNRQMLEKNIYLESGEHMTAHSYVNICAGAIKIRELKWAEEFTIKYKNRLLPNHQQNAYLFNYAGIHYIKGNDAVNPKEKEKHYRKTLEYLSKVKSEDFFYMTRIKNILIMTHYQLGDLDMALNIIINYRQYLSKNKSIPEQLFERYMNFANFSYRLIKINRKTDYGALMQLKNDLSSKPKTEYKVWLMRKINEIEVRNQAAS